MLLQLLLGGILLVRLFVGGIFFVAGTIKLKGGSNQFLAAILGYELVPQSIATMLAFILPWVEVIVGGLLIFGLWSHLSTLIGAMLLLVFSSGIAISLLQGKDNNCGCYQSLTPVQWRLVYRNLLLMGLLIPIYVTNGGLWAIDTGLTLQTNGQIYFTVLIMMWLLLLISVTILHLLVKSTLQVQKT